MKRIVSFAIIFVLLMPAIHFSAWAEPLLKEEDIEISAPNAILMEKETGTIIYEKNAHERLFPASVTKVMTMLLIVEDIEKGTLSLEDVVTASQRAASFGGSCVYLEQGEQMSVRDMLKCIAVVSANDCAVAMAEHISGSESRFVERMNQKARELGMEDTHFTSCSGLMDDGKHYTTAYDVAIMSRELIGHELIKEFTTIWMDSIREGEFELSNTNKLVYWYQGCTGLKTGYTSTAKYCLAATAQRDGVEYIAVVMHADSSDDRNADAQALLNLAFASYKLRPLTMEQQLPRLYVELGKKDSVVLSYGGEEYALVSAGSGEAEYELSLPERLQAPIIAGETVGSLRVSLNGETVTTVPILAAEDVERIGFRGFFQRLGASLFGL